MPYRIEQRGIVHTEGGEVKETIPIKEANLSRYIQVSEIIDHEEETKREIRLPVVCGDKITLRRKPSLLSVRCESSRILKPPDVEVPTTVNYQGDKGDKWVWEQPSKLSEPAHEAATRLLGFKVWDA